MPAPARPRPQIGVQLSGSVPPALATAITSSSKRYGVPADVLAGIWRVESGSSYPNPYVNSSGYGGLFGTHNWNGSTQAQADTAASILARLLQQHNGDMAAALSAYSGGGYTTVPGQVSGTTLTARPRPDTQPGGGGGIGGFFGGIAGDVGSVASSAWKDALGTITGPIDVLKAGLWLLNPVTWLRAVEFAVGIGLILLSLRGLFLVFMERETGVSFNTVGGAAGVLKHRATGRADQLIPGNAGRRRAKRTAATAAAGAAERDAAFGAEIPF